MISWTINFKSVHYLYVYVKIINYMAFGVSLFLLIFNMFVFPLSTHYIVRVCFTSLIPWIKVWVCFSSHFWWMKVLVCFHLIFHGWKYEFVFLLFFLWWKYEFAFLLISNGWKYEFVFPLISNKQKYEFFSFSFSKDEIFLEEIISYIDVKELFVFE